MQFKIKVLSLAALVVVISCGREQNQDHRTNADQPILGSDFTLIGHYPKFPPNRIKIRGTDDGVMVVTLNFDSTFRQETQLNRERIQAINSFYRKHQDKTPPEELNGLDIACFYNAYDLNDTITFHQCGYDTYLDFIGLASISPCTLDSIVNRIRHEDSLLQIQEAKRLDS